MCNMRWRNSEKSVDGLDCGCNYEHKIYNHRMSRPDVAIPIDQYFIESIKEVPRLFLRYKFSNFYCVEIFKQFPLESVS